MDSDADGTNCAVIQVMLTGGRKCALCGKGMGEGQAPMAATLLVKWSNELGIRLAAPESRYLDPRCANKLQRRLKGKP